MILPSGLANEQRLALLIGNVHTVKERLEALKDTLTWEQREWLMDLLDACEKKSYKQGYTDGMTSFAWWRDGEEYVGTCGTKLKDAVANIDRSVFFKPNEVDWLTEDKKQGTILLYR